VGLCLSTPEAQGRGRTGDRGPALFIMPGRGADEPFVVIARNDSDAAILFTALLGIASSLPRLANDNWGQ